MTEEGGGVIVVDDGAIRRIVLSRPDAANALRPHDRDAVIHALAEADSDPEVRVVVISATGRHFCAGADVKALANKLKTQMPVGEAMRTIMTGAQRLVSSVLDCGKPVIAVVQGAAAGVGAHLAFAADLVVASDNASFAESFIKRGIVVDGGGAYLLSRRIGLQAAKHMAFFGDAISADQALGLGLVNEVVPLDELPACAENLAERLAASPTTAIALTKRLFNSALDTDRTAAFLAEAMAQELQSNAHDSGEGVRAFVERRPTNFIGR